MDRCRGCAPLESDILIDRHLFGIFESDVEQNPGAATGAEDFDLAEVIVGGGYFGASCRATASTPRSCSPTAPRHRPVNVGVFKPARVC
jgi:hypothetical protein